MSVGESSSISSKLLAKNPLAVTLTSGSDERKELTLSRMATTLISPSTRTSGAFSSSSSFSTATSPSPSSQTSFSSVVGRSVSTLLENVTSVGNNFLTSKAASSPAPPSTAVSSSTVSMNRWTKLNETISSSTTTISFAAELSSRLPQVMSLVDPQGIKGPLSLSSSSALSSASLSSSSSRGTDSLMIGDESERSATTDFYNNFNGNLSYFFNDSSLPGNDTIDELGPENYNYLALLLFALPLVALFGNVLIILSVKRERSLWNVTNYFIVSLAVADLLVAAVVMPFGVYFLFNGTIWGLPPIYCDFYIAMDVSCSTSSILNLVAISIDRFIAVTQPIKYAKHKSNTRVWLTIVFVWVFSALVGSPIVLGLNNPPDDGQPRDMTECSFHNKYFVLFSSLCSFYIPCTILVYLYYRIFKDQCKRNGLSRSQKDGESSLAQSPGDVSSGSANKKTASRFTLGKVHKASRKKREKSSAKRERKATKTLAIVLGLFLACWLPFFTCNIMEAICSMMGKECSPGMTEFLLTTWLGYINSCLNPVIYTVFNPEFRKAFKKILGMGP